MEFSAATYYIRMSDSFEELDIQLKKFLERDYYEKLKKKIEEYRKGIVKIEEIPEDYSIKFMVKRLNGNQKIIKNNGLFKMLSLGNQTWLENEMIYPDSGWKIHIYGENIWEAYIIFNTLKELINSQKIHCKIATSRFFLENDNPKKIQFGKALVIYIPFIFIKNKTYISFFQNIKKEVDKCEKLLLSKGEIKGDKLYSDRIGYRYELDIPIRNEEFTLEEIDHNYRKNDGKSFNIPGNPDLF